MLDAPIPEFALCSDEAKIANLLDGYSEEEDEALRCAGCRKSEELLDLHRAKVEHLAEALAERMELDQAAIDQILIPNGQ